MSDDEVRSPPPNETSTPADTQALEAHITGYKKRRRREQLTSRSLHPYSSSDSPPAKSTSASTGTPPSQQAEDDSDSDDETSDPQRIRDRIAARLNRLSRSNTFDEDAPTTMNSKANEGDIFIDARREITQEKYDKDIYQWAVLYENQRGITLFGLTSYSSSSLLPNDPPPFTVPLEPGQTDPEAMITPHNLRDYQLPDVNWVWLHKYWLVDMGKEGGSHDGWEYNWFFRRKGWHTAPGPLSFHGWVRRRRWIRLMMRPADVLSHANSQHRLSSILTPSASTLSSAYLAKTYPSSSAVPSLTGSNLRPQRIWTGDTEQDWERAKAILAQLGTDGRRIAMWKRWLNMPENSHEDGGRPKKRKQSEEDVEVVGLSPIKSDPSRAGKSEEKGKGKENSGSSTLEEDGERSQLEWVLKVLEAHAPTVLGSFVYPDSRARFLQMLRSHAGLYEDGPKVANVDMSGMIHQLNTLVAREFWSLRVNGG